MVGLTEMFTFLVEILNRIKLGHLILILHEQPRKLQVKTDEVAGLNFIH